MSEAGVAITTVLCILVVVDIVGNSFVCWIIKKNRDMRTPINYLLVNLAVADIMFAAFITPNIISSMIFTLPDGQTGTVLCKLLIGGNIAWFGSASTFATLTVIAIERYYVVMYPLSSACKLTKRKLKVIIPSSWIFAILLTFPQFVARESPKETNFCVDIWPEKWMGEAYGLSWLVVVVLSCAIMVVLYSRVVYTLWFNTNDGNQLSYQQRGVLKVRKRVTLMVVAVSAIYGICWLTDTIEYALTYLTSYKSGPIQSAITNTMVLFNSAVNPFVYALMNRQFRDKMKRMMSCISRVHSTNDLGSTELACNSTIPTARQCLRKQCLPRSVEVKLT